MKPTPLGNQRFTSPLLAAAALIGLALLAGIIALGPARLASAAMPAASRFSAWLTPIGHPPAVAALGATWRRPRDEMTMRFVPGGEFSMGSLAADINFAYDICTQYNLGCHTCSPGRDICHRDWFADQQPAHRVRLDGFWLDQTEVANAQYARCVAAGACTPPAETGFYLRQNYYADPQYAAYPVLYVNWHQADGYCAWTGGRLPTEAEWEYAAAGPASLAFPWGRAFDGQRLNFCDKNCWLPGGAKEWNDRYEETAPVGSYPAGASWAGVLDMAGNAAEWVADWYAADYYSHAPAQDPPGPATGEQRVQRGGAWGLQPLYADAHYRTAKLPDTNNLYVGFRCARSASRRVSNP